MARAATVAALEDDVASAASTTRHALYLLYVLAVFVLTLEAKVNPASVAAVGCLVGSGGNLLVRLPYNGIAGHWSHVLLWSQAPERFGDWSGAFAFLTTRILIACYLLSNHLLTIYGILRLENDGETIRRWLQCLSWSR